MSKSSDKVKAWRKAAKERMVASMGGKCQCCGYNKCNESLDFHHINPEEKEISLGSIRANPRAWPVIVNELRKCILVCRNCHGEIHHGQREIPEAYARFDERYLEYQAHSELMDDCPTCGKAKLSCHRYCSHSCARKMPVQWGNYNLEELIKERSVQAIADQIGVSNGAVSKRLSKLGIRRPHRSQKAKRSYQPFVYVKTNKPAKPRISDIDPDWRHRPRPSKRKVERPLKSDLEKMIWNESLIGVGRRFGVTDNTVRKWAASYGITLPPQGYHQRRQCGYSHEESLISQKRIKQPKRRITKDIAEAVYAMVKEGVSYRKAAAAFGFKHWGMRQAIERYGLEPIKHKVAVEAGNDPAISL